MESPATATAHRRKPLQLRNFNYSPLIRKTKLQKTVSGKENELFDQHCSIISKKEEEKRSLGIVMQEASLAEELEMVRRRNERLRIEKEKTEKMLRHREEVIDRAVKDTERRAEEQRLLEIEVDALLRLIHLSSSSRFPPFRSLREQEQKLKQSESQSDLQVAQLNMDGALHPIPAE